MHKNYFINYLSSNKTLFITKVLVVLAASSALALLSQLTVPLWPVPITGQILGLVLLGIALGPTFGFIAVVNYIILGLLGLPVFAFGNAFATTLISPSFGYIIGFPFATLLMGYFYHYYNIQSIFKFTIAAIVALLPVYVLGLIWLGYFVGFNANVFKFGLYPFIIGDMIKIIIAYSLSKIVYKKIS